MILNRLLISKQVSTAFNEVFKHRIKIRLRSTVDVLEKIDTHRYNYQSKKAKMKVQLAKQRPYRIYWQVAFFCDFSFIHILNIYLSFNI